MQFRGRARLFFGLPVSRKGPEYCLAKFLHVKSEIKIALEDFSCYGYRGTESLVLSHTHGLLRPSADMSWCQDVAFRYFSQLGVSSM